MARDIDRDDPEHPRKAELDFQDGKPRFGPHRHPSDDSDDEDDTAECDASRNTDSHSD